MKAPLRKRGLKADLEFKKSKKTMNCYVHASAHESAENGRLENIRARVCVPSSLYLFREFDGKHYCLFHLPTKEKDSELFMNEFRTRLNDIENKAAEINEDFPEDKERQDELKNEHSVKHDFRFVWFPSRIDFPRRTLCADFDLSHATFADEILHWFTIFEGTVDFSSSRFLRLASFESAVFDAHLVFCNSEFVGLADFNDSKFYSANFQSAIFRDVALFSGEVQDSVEFEATEFYGRTIIRLRFPTNLSFRLARFHTSSETSFDECAFEKTVSFERAVIEGYLEFRGNKQNLMFPNQESALDLQNARIDDPKKITFHTVRLEPSWFINTDATGLVFTDCRWRNADGNLLKTKNELKNLKTREFDNPNALLTKASWQLAVNHEESKSFAKSSLFRTLANESKRLETPWFSQPFSLHWWYYFVSFYGEDWRRSLFVLIGILMLFGVLYWSPFSRFDYGEKSEIERFGKSESLVKEQMRYREMELTEGLTHSLYVAALQRPEPKPADTKTKVFVILETIFAPLQAALLALAIRRKFMR